MLEVHCTKTPPSRYFTEWDICRSPVRSRFRGHSFADYITRTRGEFALCYVLTLLVLAKQMRECSVVVFLPAENRLPYIYSTQDDAPPRSNFRARFFRNKGGGTHSQRRVAFALLPVVGQIVSEISCKRACCLASYTVDFRLYWVPTLTPRECSKESLSREMMKLRHAALLSFFPSFLPW